MTSQTATNTNSYAGYASASSVDVPTTGAAERILRYSEAPEQVLKTRELPRSAKLLYSELGWQALTRELVDPGITVLARRLGTTRSTVRRDLGLLDRVGLIRTIPRKSGQPYACRVNRDYCVGASVPILNSVVERKDLNAAQKVVECLLSFRQGANDCCWPTQRDIAEQLGMPLRTVQRTIASLRRRGLLQVKRGRNHINRYRVTFGGVPGERVYGKKPAGHERSAASKRMPPLLATLDKTIVETPIGVGFLKQKFTFSPILSRLTPEAKAQSRSTAQSRIQTRAGPAYKTELEPERVYRLLTDRGVAPKVARPMAFEQFVPWESADHAIWNGEILRNSQWQEDMRAGLPKRRFNLPGYIVQAVNGARHEGKIVKETELFREVRRERAAHKKAEARRKDRQPPSLEECEKRRRAMKKALGV